MLSENDTKFLSSFFDDITADQYNMPSFGEGLNFSDAWLDLPPQFMGHSTSLGPAAEEPMLSANPHAFLNNPPPSEYTTTISGAQLMPPPRPIVNHQPQPQQLPQQLQSLPPQKYQRHSDDVMNAAATLLRNGSNPRSASRNKDPRRPLGPPMGHLRHQGLDEFKEDSNKDSVGEHDHTFTHWMFGGKGKDAASPPNTHMPDLQWGSDAGFASMQRNYVPAPNKESVESHHAQQMQVLDCLEPSKSAANTRPGSPSPMQYQVKMEDADAPPRKRRKSKNQKDGSVDDDDDDDDDSDEKSASRKKKGKGTNGIPSPPDSNGKRRRSAAQSKLPRENLTDEQKRSNHIRSEQKRRTVIKEGFDDLCELVPGLQGGGFSKSTMLTMAAEWLEELLQGNETLTAQLG